MPVHTEQTQRALMAVKNAARVATTANITLSGTQTIDGVALSVGDRVLVKNQSTGAQNGVYVVQSGAWVRATDFDQDYEVKSGVIVPVTEGTSNGDKAFQLTTNDPITVGTTALTFIATADAAIAAHEAAGDPHTGYQRESEKGVANGYAGLGSDALVPAAQAPRMTVQSKTAGYTVVDGDGLILCDATGGAFTIALPTAVGRTGMRLTVKKTDASSNAIVVDPNGAETIEGAATFGIGGQNHSVLIESDGANWRIIARYPRVPFATTSKTATYTALDGDEVILCDGTSGAFSINLPTAVGRTGKLYIVKKTDVSGNAITVDPAGSETIDGAATFSLATQFDSLAIASDGTNWQRFSIPAMATATVAGVVKKAAALGGTAPADLTDNTGVTPDTTLENVAASTAQDSTTQTQNSLTDNTGETADTTIAQVDALITDPGDTPVTADALRNDLVANTIPSIENRLDLINKNFADLVAQLAKIRTDVAALNTTVQLGPTKASLDTRLQSLENNDSDLGAMVDRLTAKVLALEANLQAAGSLA